MTWSYYYTKIDFYISLILFIYLFIIHIVIYIFEYSGFLLYITIPLNFLFLYLTLSNLALYNIEKLKESEQMEKDKKLEEEYKKYK